MDTGPLGRSKTIGIAVVNEVIQKTHTIVVLTRPSQLDLEKTETNNLKQSTHILPNKYRIKVNGAGGGTRTRMTEVAGF